MAAVAGARRRPGAGRKPKPTATKIAEGNPGGRQLNYDEPKYEALDYMAAPPIIKFSKYAVEKWDYLIKQLILNEVLTKADLHNLEQMCYWLGIWHEAAKDIDTQGITIPGQRGGWVQNPSVGAAAKASSLVNQYSSVLGLDPTSRQRVMGKKAETKEDRYTSILDGD